MWRDRLVEFRYRRGDREVARTVAPYGLVLKNGIWYLTGQIGEDYRTYRVDRVRDVRDAGAGFTRDESFDLVAHWRASAHGFVRGMLAERVTGAGRATSGCGPSVRRRRALRVRACPGGRRPAGQPGPGGHPEFPGRVGGGGVPRAAATLGPEVEVLAPTALRDLMAGAARRLAAHYRH